MRPAARPAPHGATRYNACGAGLRVGPPGPSRPGAAVMARPLPRRGRVCTTECGKPSICPGLASMPGPAATAPYASCTSRHAPPTPLLATAACRALIPPDAAFVSVTKPSCFQFSMGGTLINRVTVETLKEKRDKNDRECKRKMVPHGNVFSGSRGTELVGGRTRGATQILSTRVQVRLGSVAKRWRGRGQNVGAAAGIALLPRGWGDARR